MNFTKCAGGMLTIDLGKKVLFHQQSAKMIKASPLWILGILGGSAYEQRRGCERWP